MDIIDILLKAGIFATFVLFALAIFCIKLCQVKSKKENQVDDQKNGEK